MRSRHLHDAVHAGSSALARSAQTQHTALIAFAQRIIVSGSLRSAPRRKETSRDSLRGRSGRTGGCRSSGPRGTSFPKACFWIFGLWVEWGSGSALVRNRCRLHYPRDNQAHQIVPAEGTLPSQMTLASCSPKVPFLLLEFLSTLFGLRIVERSSKHLTAARKIQDDVHAEMFVAPYGVVSPRLNSTSVPHRPTV